MKKSNEYRPWRIALLSLLFGILFLFGCGLFILGIWYNQTYDLGFNELLYTLASPLKGTGEGTMSLILRTCLPWLVLCAVLYVAAALVLSRRGEIFGRLRKIGARLCAGVLGAALIFAALTLHLPSYLLNRLNSTSIYEDYYVDPRSVVIESPNGKANNLIYIYLESMETTYASLEDGGYQPNVNYIPKLTELAKQGISFTNKEEGLLGGFSSPNGTGWTMAALLSTTSGVPFAFPVGADLNDISKRESFATGLYSLGNILEDKGYRQMFLCGSDSEFGGRRTYFTSHGNYEIFDYYTAKEQGYIDENYYVWWGFEDEILYRIAKDQLNEMAAGDQPFNFTMLTVDTHHVDGYVCKSCDASYEGQLEKVLHCADSQLAAFVEWCQAQPFYENTTIVITGDHPRMDTTYVDGLDVADRTIYNCIFNSAVQPQGSTSNRVFTPFDMFPTVLAAMGYTIEGERLGLGVNLFSAEHTLAEQIGYEFLNKELAKHSEFYLKRFT